MNRNVKKRISRQLILFLCIKSKMAAVHLRRRKSHNNMHRKEVSLMAALKDSRHEKFVQNLINGMSQRKAYRAAYKNSKNWKDSTVDSRASELFKDSKVLGRYLELQEQIAKSTILSASERKEYLTKIVNSPYEKTENKLKAIDVLNKMDGEYKSKVEVSGVSEGKKMLDSILDNLIGGDG